MKIRRAATHRARANGIDDEHDRGLADDEGDHNIIIIIPFDSDSDESPRDSLEGLEFRQPADRQSTTFGEGRRTRGSWSATIH